MISNKLSFIKQFDDRHYHADIPHSGSWQEALAFAHEFLSYVTGQHDEAKKKLEESQVAAKEVEVVDAVVEPDTNPC